MVAHEHIGIKGKTIAVPIDSEDLAVFLVVGCFLKYFLALIATYDGMIECAFKLYAWLARHDSSYHNE
jgi:hypothetical protein